MIIHHPLNLPWPTPFADMHSQWRQTNEDWTDRGILSSEEIWYKMKDD